MNGIAEASYHIDCIITRVASHHKSFLSLSTFLLSFFFCLSHRVLVGRKTKSVCCVVWFGFSLFFIFLREDTHTERDGYDEDWGREEAEDEDRVHSGPRITVGPNDREASASRHERGALQLLPWVPRVPPGNPRQPPRRHGEHRYSLRRHARHQGTIRPPDSIFIFHILPFLFDLYLFYLFIFSSPILFWFTFKSCVLIANVYDWIRLCISGCYYYYYLILAQLCMCVEVKCWDLST